LDFDFLIIIIQKLFLFNQIGIGFNNIVLNFFATFGLVLGMQITLLKSLL